MKKSIKINFESMSTFGKVVTGIGILGFIACCACSFIPDMPSGFAGCLSCLGSLFASALFAAITWRKVDELNKKFRNGVINKIARVYDSKCSGNLKKLMDELTNENRIVKEFADVFPGCTDCVIRYNEKYGKLYDELYPGGKPTPSFRDGKRQVVSWNTFRSFDTPIGDEYFDAEKFRSLRKKFKEDLKTALHRDLFDN